MSYKDLIVDFRRVPASQIAEHPENWRRHPESQEEALRGIFDEVGIVAPSIYNERTHRLLDGHLRRKVLEAAGDQLVPLIVVDVPEEQEATVLASFDQITQMARMDRAKFDALLDKVKVSDPRVAALFNHLRQDGCLTPRQGVGGDKGAQEPHPELLAKWGVEVGAIYQVGRHRVACGSCLDEALVARLMGGELASLVFTDPPYGVDYTGDLSIPRDRLAGDDSSGLYAQSLPVASRHSTPTAALYLWYAPTRAEEVLRAVRESGYQVRNELIWAKNQAQMGTKTGNYKAQHEPFLYCHKRGESPAWYGPTNETTLWQYPRSAKNEWHPTQKPPELAARAIANSSRAGEIVLDLFLGSGATAVGAEQVGRVCYGCDISPGYVAGCLERLSRLGLSVSRVEC